MKKTFFAVAVFVVFMAAGCAENKANLAEKTYFPKNVAVLPIDNRSNDMTGPDLIRKGFKKIIENKGFVVKDLSETDNVLNGMGVTDAGQLNGMDSAQVAKVLGVDGVFYGTLLEFNYVTLGIYYKRQVRVEFKFVEALSGKALWQEEKQVKNSEMSLNRDKIKEQIATKFVEKIFRITMIEEVDEVLKRIIETLPDAR